MGVPVYYVVGPPGGGKSHLSAALGLALVENGWRVIFARTTDLVQRLQVARRELALESTIAKLDRYDLLILDDIAYVNQGSSRNERTVRVDRCTLRTAIHADHGQSAVRRMGKDFSRPGYDARGHRSPCPPLHDPGDECRELSPSRGPRSKARSRPATSPRDNQENREGRRLIDVPRQSKPCQDAGQRQLSLRSAALVSSRLTRRSHPDCRAIIRSSAVAL